jgi:hypothetical protein
MAHVPPPPQAEGRKIFLLPKVESNVEPAEAISGFFSSPLMMILTSPEDTNFDCAKRRTNTSSKIIRVNATIEVMITELI